MVYTLAVQLSVGARARRRPAALACSQSRQTLMAPGKPDVRAKFRAALEAMYGNRIERVLLFGSQARGDARPDSDYDVAVFLKDLDDRWAELDRLALLRVAFLDETGVFFDALPYPAQAYQERSPLMHEIRREGVAL